MTSRTVRSAEPTTTVAGPGDRSHLPPVAPAGRTSRRSDRKAPLAWLPWLLLGLLALTLLAAALLAKAAGDGDSATRSSDSTASQDGSAAQGGAGSGSAAADGSGTLTAGGQDLLAVPGGKIASLQDQTAKGTANVESVVADEGFWVGESADKRVFVFLTPEARRSAGESGFQVKAGQTVSLEGVVKAASPEFAQSAGVTDAEGSAQLVEQGAYVEAATVRLAE